METENHNIEEKISYTLDADEQIILQLKQHRGFLVLLGLLIPILFYAFSLSIHPFVSNDFDGNPFVLCSCCFSLLFALGVPILFFSHLAKRPEWLLTNKRIIAIPARFQGNPVDLAAITKITLFQQAAVGEINFGTIWLDGVQAGKKVRSYLFGVPAPELFVQKIISQGIPQNVVIKRHNYQWSIYFLGVLYIFAILILLLFLVFAFNRT